MSKVLDRNNLEERRLILPHGFRMLLSIIFVHPNQSEVGQLMIVGAMIKAVYFSADKKPESMTGTRARNI